MINILKAAKKDAQTILTIGNEATLALHRKGIRQWEYPWPAGQVEDTILDGNAFILLFNGIPAGSFFLKKITELGAAPVNKESFYLSKIAILPEFQGQGLGRYIVEWAWNFSKSSGNPLYLDCWAGNEKLKQFYQTAGLAHIGDFPEEDYFISVFKGAE